MGNIEDHSGELAKVKSDHSVEGRPILRMPQVWLVLWQAGALETDLLLLLLKTLPCSGSGGLPFSVYEFGNAEFAPAGGVGALDGRVAGNVIAHVLHQLLQLGACGEEEGVRPGYHIPWSLISRWGWVEDEPGDWAGCGLLQGAHSIGLPPSCREVLFGPCSRRFMIFCRHFRLKRNPAFHFWLSLGMRRECSWALV